MNRVASALKALYNFFSGDVVTLSATFLAFALGLVLIQVLHASSVFVAVAFVATIVAGLITTLRREIAGRPRARS
jgi:hypothetical protein